jgi:hypothetical protein
MSNSSIDGADDLKEENMNIDKFYHLGSAMKEWAYFGFWVSASVMCWVAAYRFLFA